MHFVNFIYFQNTNFFMKFIELRTYIILTLYFINFDSSIYFLNFK